MKNYVRLRLRGVAAVFRSSSDSKFNPLQHESPPSPVFSHPEIHQIRMSAKKLFSAKSPRPQRLRVIFISLFCSLLRKLTAENGSLTTLFTRYVGTKSHPPLAQRTLSLLVAH